MKPLNTISIMLLLVTNSIFAQFNTNQTLFTVNNKNISAAEFMRIYEKNNPNAGYSQQLVTDYLNRYILFKQKVAEAYAQKLHTNKKVLAEIEGYKKELAKPYLLDQRAIDQLVREAYERSKIELRVKHIFVRIAQNPQRKDTLMAYRKIEKLRKRILNGESFDSVAISASDDPSASRNHGDLGYVTALSIPDYQFENHLYRAKLNTLSQPLRSGYGYHLIKVTNRRPASGQIKVAHLMLTVNPADSLRTEEIIERRIREIAGEAQAGFNFKELVEKYSDDKSSATVGGELQWFGIGQMPFEFQEAALSLDANGQISKPVRTKYGWHIIKRIDKKELPPFAAMEPELRQKISRDNRGLVGRQKLINQLKNEYNYQLIKSLNSIYAVVDSTLLDAQWDKKRAEGFQSDLVKLGDTVVNEADFTDFLYKNQYVTVSNKNARTIVNEIFEDFVNQLVLNYEETQLEKKYPEYKLTLQEYFEGILLFEISEKEVWAKAVKDSIGQRTYYLNHPEKYQTTASVECKIYSYNSPDDKKALVKILDKARKKNYSHDEIIEAINKNGRLTYDGTQKYISSQQNLPQAIRTFFNEPMQGVIDIENPTQNQIFRIIDYQASTLEPFQNIQGFVIADYEKQLESKWIEKLEKKYPPKINQNVLENLISSKSR